jgi:hypothetical protein
MLCNSFPDLAHADRIFSLDTVNADDNAGVAHYENRIPVRVADAALLSNAAPAEADVQRRNHHTVFFRFGPHVNMTTTLGILCDLPDACSTHPLQFPNAGAEPTLGNFVRNVSALNGASRPKNSIAVALERPSLARIQLLNLGDSPPDLPLFLPADILNVQRVRDLHGSPATR